MTPIYWQTVNNEPSFIRNQIADILLPSQDWPKQIGEFQRNLTLIICVYKWKLKFLWSEVLMNADIFLKHCRDGIHEYINLNSPKHSNKSKLNGIIHSTGTQEKYTIIYNCAFRVTCDHDLQVNNQITIWKLIG